MENFEDWLANFSSETNEEVLEKSTKSYKLDMFKEVLPALDSKNFKYYSNLTEDEKKELGLWLVMRWMTSARSNDYQPYYLMMVNNVVNYNFSLLSPKKSLDKQGHPELQWMLLCLCGGFKNINRDFIPVGKGAVKDKLDEHLSKFYPNLSDYELELLKKLNSKSEIIQFFKDNGYSDSDIKQFDQEKKSKKAAK